MGKTFLPLSNILDWETLNLIWNWIVIQCHIFAGVELLEAEASPEGVRPEQKEEEKEQKKEKEDGHLEDWRRKELVAECKALGLSDYGVRADLVARIKEARAAAQSDNERPRRPRGPRRQEQDKVE